MGDLAGTLYDDIGRSYSATRRTDPRVAAQVGAALEGARSVLNVGAGTGSYEPAHGVIALEPSWTMLAQRPAGSAPAIRGVAEALPCADRAFDAALAVLTMHHWTDLSAGLRELRRVAARQVIFFFEPLVSVQFWLLDYFPGAADTDRRAPGRDEIGATLDLHEVQVVPVPADCADGFAAAFWARPERYLEPQVQAGMSLLARLPRTELSIGTRRLRADLGSGEWERRFGHLRSSPTLDGGCRLAICGGPG